ncbi:hypothetical protein ANCCAN_23634 [Ancylostoma caninum]|uniref:Uncharacterized protein n=1 Tax=Ancylostoma caninum TaxID=29170 RepID=A0A368FKA2_ANCCA|nr:hypothetical protein ANCCAN_23634 [Ancylostoma caninum]
MCSRWSGGGPDRQGANFGPKQCIGKTLLSSGQLFSACTRPRARSSQGRLRLFSGQSVPELGNPR